MAALFHMLTWINFLCHFTDRALSYQITTVDAIGGCNETIYLQEGAKSAAILRLTSKDYYDTSSPINCVFTFKAPQHNWSGLTGVLEEVDLRRYEDTADHHLAQNQCVDFIKVLHDSPQPQNEQCGSWSINGVDQLSHIGFRRSLFGYCPNPPDPGSAVQCGISELTVQVSIGKRDFSNLMKGKPWRPHRGFTFVVTAYQYSRGESGCAEGLKSCRKTDYHGYQHHCVHESLWCDNHINCGQMKNMDETSCHNDEMLSGLVTVMVGPWVGAALLVVLVLAGVLFWRRAKPNPPPGPPQPQDHNSYAESYEVSSTMSSAHHMAIQVRVVCNSGHGLHPPRLTPWQAADLPPSYDSLFPQGPPPKSTSASSITNAITSSSAGFNISTTSLVNTSIGSNANSTPGPSGFYSNTTQTSSIVIPISAICNTLGTSAASSASYSTITTANTVTSCTPTVTNTTTSTTTISSVGASPAALASISFTSVSLAGPSDALPEDQNKDNDNPSPSHSNSISNNNVPTSDSTIHSKSDRESPQCMIEEAASSQGDSEDSNRDLCASAIDIPIAPDTNSPYQSTDANQSSESLSEQACDKESLSSIASKNTADQSRSVYNDGESVSQPSTMSASCTDCETSERPDSESEETDEITLEDEESSRAVVVDEDSSTRFNRSANTNTEESHRNNDITKSSSFHELHEERLMHEHSLDKDDESLL